MFIVNDAWFFVSHRLPIAIQAIEAGFQVHVLAKRDSSVKKIEAAGCIFHEWKLAPRGRTITNEIVSFVSVFRAQRRIKPDIVHLVTIKSVLYGGLSARFNRISRVVIAVAGMGALFDTKRSAIHILQPLIKLLYKTATNHRYSVCIFQNNEDKNTFKNLFKLKETDIRLFHGSGVDLGKYTSEIGDTTALTVVMGARLIKEKGVFEFIEAARYVKRRFPEVRFILAGGTVAEGNPGAVSLIELEEANTDSAIEIAGHIEDMRELLSSAAIVTLPSYYNEGLPKFLAEAAAAGKPVVTTNHPGCRDAIEANKTGLLVEIGNSRALADAIIELLENPRQRMDMGIAARERAESLFNVDVIANNHVQLYRELISQHG